MNWDAVGGPHSCRRHSADKIAVNQFYKEPALLISIVSLATCAVNLHGAPPSVISSVNKNPANRIIILNNPSDAEIKQWESVVKSAELFVYDFSIITNQHLFSLFPAASNPIDVERAIRMECNALNSNWIAINASGQILSHGISVPSINELSNMITSTNTTSKIKSLKSFLGSNPDHIEARADFLTELRRIAIKYQSSRLGNNSSSTAWSEFAHEIDSTFNSSWKGLTIRFFSANIDPPESKITLLKPILLRHIKAVESAIHSDPCNDNYWNIWGWMAQCIDYTDMFSFVDSVNTMYPNGIFTSPSPDVAAWLTRVAYSKSDWNRVIRFSKLCLDYSGRSVDQQAKWIPGAIIRGGSFERIPGYPEESSYMPLLEALLRTGRVNEANYYYDKLLRERGQKYITTAASIAKSAGYADIYALWSHGAIINSAPYFKPATVNKPNIVINARRDSNYAAAISAISNSTDPTIFVDSRQPKETISLGWTGDTPRWALINSDGSIITQGFDPPKHGVLQALLDQAGAPNDITIANDLLKQDPSNIPALRLIIESLTDRNMRSVTSHVNNSTHLTVEQDTLIWGEIQSAWFKLLETQNGLTGWVFQFKPNKDLTKSHLMRSVANKAIKHIELELHGQPNSINLWRLWLYWRLACDTRPHFFDFITDINLSPFSSRDNFPPAIVLQYIYEECETSKQWDTLSRLLYIPWNRISLEYSTSRPKSINPRIGSTIVAPLAVSLLQIGKFSDIDDIIALWLSWGGSSSDLFLLIDTCEKLKLNDLRDKWMSMLSLKR